MQLKLLLLRLFQETKRERREDVRQSRDRCVFQAQVFSRDEFLPPFKLFDSLIPITHENCPDRGSFATSWKSCSHATHLRKYLSFESESLRYKHYFTSSKERRYIPGGIRLGTEPSFHRTCLSLSLSLSLCHPVITFFSLVQSRAR